MKYKLLFTNTIVYDSIQITIKRAKPEQFGDAKLKGLK